VEEVIVVIELFIEVDRKQVIIDVPQVNKHTELKNIVAYTLEKDNTKSIFAFGNDEQDLQNSDPEEWAKYKTNARFAHPFDTTHFDPAIAATFLDYAALLAQDRIGCTSMMAVTFDRFNFYLQMRSYEALSQMEQQEFENTFYKSSMPKKGLWINGRDTKREHRQRTLAARVIEWIGIVCMMLSILMIGVVHPLEILRAINVTSLANLIFFASLFLVLLAIVMCGGLTFGALLSLLVLRQFFARTLLITAWGNARLGLPKSIGRWLIDTTLG
jgi:hypothetical protein